MKRMILRAFKFGDYAFPDKASLVGLADVIKAKLQEHKILCSVKIGDDSINFEVVPGKEPQRLFMFAEHNHVILKADDPRVKKNNRNYLLSHRLTEKQIDMVWEDIINGTLDKLGVSCDIVLQEFEDDPSAIIPLREGMLWGEWKFKEKNYPVEAK